MRYLHPVQAHETFLGSGEYRFRKDGRELAKSETWQLHGQGDGGRFLRVDLDARREEGKSILLEALMNACGGLARFDLRYENARFDGGIKELRASYHFAGSMLQLGYNLNGGSRQYRELKLPQTALIDIPLLRFRGPAVKAMASETPPAYIFAPMFEHAQLFPGRMQPLNAQVDCAGEDVLLLGRRQVATRRYTYRNQALAYWIDRNDVVIKRVNAFRQQEFVAQIHNYAGQNAQN